MESAGVVSVQSSSAAGDLEHLPRIELAGDGQFAAIGEANAGTGDEILDDARDDDAPKGRLVEKLAGIDDSAAAGDTFFVELAFACMERGPQADADGRARGVEGDCGSMLAGTLQSSAAASKN